MFSKGWKISNILKSALSEWQGRKKSFGRQLFLTSTLESWGRGSQAGLG
jgi:hypothetical protein